MASTRCPTHRLQPRARRLLPLHRRRLDGGRLAVLRGWGCSSEQLVEHLQDGDAFIRRSAATNLGPCRLDAAQVVPALVGGLEDFDREVRRCAVHSLGTIGPAARPAVPMILDELVRTTSAPFHLDAVRALGRIGPRDRGLAERDFFSSGRTVEEIHEELTAGQSPGLAPTSLYAPLVALVKEGILTRTRDGEGWVYVAKS